MRIKSKFVDSESALSGKVLTADGSGKATWQTVTGSVSLSTASIPFTDGDLLKRVNIVDAGVGLTTVILCSIQRPTTTELNDNGYMYIATVVNRAVGSFDVVVTCFNSAGEDCTDNPPNETVTLVYLKTQGVGK